MPNVIAASSPSSITFKIRDCVKKNNTAKSTKQANSGNLFQLAEARLPIDQKVTDLIPSALLAKKTIKLEKAPSNALTMDPDNTSFTEVIRPPILDKIKT